MFSLALRLGMTVGQLSRSINSRELSEWAAYFNLEKNPPKEEPFSSPDPVVQADAMREIFGASKAPTKKKRRQ